jgi:hypothetical protein
MGIKHRISILLYITAKLKMLVGRVESGRDFCNFQRVGSGQEPDGSGRQKVTRVQPCLHVCLLCGFCEWQLRHLGVSRNLVGGRRKVESRGAQLGQSNELSIVSQILIMKFVIRNHIFCSEMR